MPKKSSLFAWGCAATILALGVLLLANLLFLRERTLENGQRLAHSYASVLRNQMVRVVFNTEKVLDATRRAYRAMGPQAGVDLDVAMQDLLARQPELDRLWITDKNGKVVHDTHPIASPLDQSDRDFFVVHKEGIGPNMFVGAPVLSRRTSRWQMAFSQGLQGSNGQFDGIVAASIDPMLFDAQWRALELGERGTVELIRADGALLFRSPFNSADLGADPSQIPAYLGELSKSDEGVFTYTSPVDDVVRQYAYHHFHEGVDWILLVGLDQRHILEPWQQTVRLTLLLFVLIAGGGVAVIYVVRASVARQESAEAEAALRAHALDATTQGVVVSDAAGRVLTVNNAFVTLTGYTQADIQGKTCAILQGEGSDPSVKNSIQMAMAKHEAIECEILNYHKSGRAFWNQLSIAPVRNAEGAVTNYVGVQRDATAEHAARLNMVLTQRVFQQAREGITVTDARCNIQRINPALTTITGYSEEDVLGKNPRIFSSGLQDTEFYQNMWNEVLQKDGWSGEIRNRNKNGAVYPAWLTISALRDEHGDICNFIGSLTDLTQIRATENRVYRLAHFDPLTGLPNQTVLLDRTSHAISMAQRSQEPLCLMRVGIDNFRALCEAHGHSVGDKLLVDVAQRLSAVVREQDTVSHNAGQEFSVLLPSTDSAGAAHMAGDMLWTLAQPYKVDGQRIEVTASIGIASFPENGKDFDSLMGCAELAMHRAQVDGNGNFRFYSDDLYTAVKARETMARALRQAIGNSEFEVLYQPLADFQTGCISGMEALLRWTRPEMGAVSPAVFIPLAEETGSIRAIGKWVLCQVCRDIVSWKAQGLMVPKVAVNVSAAQFRDPDYLHGVQKVVEDSAISAENIFLEVTESALMDDVQRCEYVLSGLKRMGFGLSLDDFGTGYSSLSYLKRYPFDKVKIDQSFIRDIETNAVDSVIVNVIISMAHGLGLKVVAEGVETEAQCEIMRSSVCDEVQGYFFSRPVDSKALAGLLQENRQLPSHLLRFRPLPRALLLVDDEPNVLSSLKRLFRRDGYVIYTANGGAQGLEVLAQEKVDVIISDQRMPGMTGVEFLREAKKLYPDTIRIVLSGYTELQSVTDAINEGAIYRFLTKPWVDEQLREQVHKAFEHIELLEKNRQLDIRNRATNQELVAANRHLGLLIETTKKHVELESASLAIVREALQLVPIPVLGVDDQLYIMFSNKAAEQAFPGMGGLLGSPLQDLHADLPQWLAQQQEGERGPVALGNGLWTLRWNAMGKNSSSRGALLSLTLLGESNGGNAP